MYVIPSKHVLIFKFQIQKKRTVMVLYIIKQDMHACLSSNLKYTSGKIQALSILVNE